MVLFEMVFKVVPLSRNSWRSQAGPEVSEAMISSNPSSGFDLAELIGENYSWLGWFFPVYYII